MNEEKKDAVETLNAAPIVNNTTEEVLDDIPVSNVPNKEVEIKQTATIKSEVGTSVIGQINGDTITATNNPIPDKLDINSKPKNETKTNTKKVKVSTKREKIMGILSLILVIFVIAGGGVAVYYFGFLNNPNNFNVKNLSFELGSELPTGVNNYITSSNKIDGMEYSLDISKVDSKIGSYSYSVTHKGVTKNGTITIKDSQAPVVTLKDNLSFSKGTTITKDDLVSTCVDLSNCTYDLEKNVDTSTSGTINVNVIAKDDAGNSVTTTAKVTIVDIAKTLVCTSKPELASDGTYNTVIEDTINFDSTDKLVSSSSKKIVSYIDLNQFFTLYNAKKDDSSYSFDKVKFNYSMKNDIDINDLSNYNDINASYTAKAYTCK